MIQMVNQWCVKVNFTEGKAPVEFIVNKMFYSEVLHHIAQMTFHEEVFKIEVWLRKNV